MTLSEAIKTLLAKTAAERERRIRALYDIVVGMPEIRMHTWEYPFARIIESARK